MSTDRRAGKRNVPHVGKQPRARRDDGAWRRKRSDAGKPRKGSDGSGNLWIIAAMIGAVLVIAGQRAR